SVWDKTGLLELGKALSAQNVEILASGNTAKFLSEQNIDVVEISDYTQSPEIMSGRVKTLHPRVHGGILARREIVTDLAELASINGREIDLVVVNLYPFENNVGDFYDGKKNYDEMTELIDIGGPTLIRAAAKNHKYVTVLTNPAQYQEFIETFADLGATSLSMRKNYAKLAFEHTAGYDAVISRWFVEQSDADLFKVDTLVTKFEKVNELRYGENPHQKATFYREITGRKTCDMAHAEQLHGQQISYNNILDCDAALGFVREFEKPAVIIIKHTNACGAAVAMDDDVPEAFLKAQKADPISAYGGIIGVNRVVDIALMQEIAKPDNFFECIVAPGYTPEALELVKAGEKWLKRFRVYKIGDFTSNRAKSMLRGIEGGVLIQETNLTSFDPENLEFVTESQPTEQELSDLFFGWMVVKHTKSNAIVFVKDNVCVGVGAGQMNRADSVRLASIRAGEHSKGAVMASDAFFPFADGIELAAKAGIKAVIQPGGSIRDKSVITKCNELRIAMLFTGIRHFKH
ncbi:MAG: bifunctional phosphoribosylaminoimidazolecarboxamide formyltransferase/IMP cyclohydrolase, partial [Planctomycetes bacterium]|nr:bifunctional phosphoribosylaminoimidazolecarboxamide formyltransferase/IMP cyclohydrolase [Planctomycetota bacterium]